MPDKFPLRVRIMRPAITWIVLVVIGLGYTVYDIMLRYPSMPGPGIGQKLMVEIPLGIGPKTLSKLLEEKGIIDSPGRFRLWLRASKKLSMVKADIFELRDNMTPQQILRVISKKGDKKGLRVTIPEGFTLDRIAEVLKNAGLAASRFIEVATDKKLLTELKIPGNSAEGFLFPDTYFFEPDDDAKDIIRRMHAVFESHMVKLGLSEDIDLFKIITLASIVQAEARIMTEAPIIAGVYKNRLDLGKFPSRLMQADPTVAYGCKPWIAPRASSCEGFLGKLGRRQLDDKKNTYNTYQRSGLPPGPICSPGELAIKAALNPDKVPYLYFVAGPNGTHRFSATLADHNKAVRLYREGL